MMMMIIIKMMIFLMTMMLMNMQIIMTYNDGHVIMFHFHDDVVDYDDYDGEDEDLLHTMMMKKKTNYMT